MQLILYFNLLFDNIYFIDLLRKLAPPVDPFSTNSSCFIGLYVVVWYYLLYKYHHLALQRQLVLTMTGTKQ